MDLQIKEKHAEILHKGLTAILCSETLQCHVFIPDQHSGMLAGEFNASDMTVREFLDKIESYQELKEFPLLPTFFQQMQSHFKL